MHYLSFLACVELLDTKAVSSTCLVSISHMQ